MEVSRDKGDLYLVTWTFRICSGFPWAAELSLLELPWNNKSAHSLCKLGEVLDDYKVTGKLERGYKPVGGLGVPHMHPTILITYINCGRACCSGLFGCGPNTLRFPTRTVELLSDALISHTVSKSMLSQENLEVAVFAQLVEMRS